MLRRNTDILRRGRELKKGKRGEGPVIYWMAREQRVTDNWTLLWAQQEAIIRQKSLLVAICFTPDYQDRTPSQTLFMHEGLTTIEKELQELNIGFTILHDYPDSILPKFIHDLDAHILVCDFNPLRFHQLWKKQLNSLLTIPFYEVDSHNIIPAWTTSEKKEYAAYTIRPKIKRLLDEYLTPIPVTAMHPFKIDTHVSQKLLTENNAHLDITTGSPTSPLQPGSTKAIAAAEFFIKYRLRHYNSTRNNPCLDGQSGLSAYLHFGQLSAQRLSRMVLEENLPPEISEPFLEELIVRRELSDNYCLYEQNYDTIEGFPEWAQKSLHLHRRDTREHTYSLEVLENGDTHESLWNCCQFDLVQSGKLHGFLRMYWAKKILEWTPDPETALSYTITLNDRYSLDGHDPNGYAGIAWSIGGVHDRAWGERPVFGKIRYMNEAGCRRKFDVNSYMQNVLATKKNNPRLSFPISQRPLL